MNNWVDNRAVNEMGKLVVQFGIQVKKSTRLENIHSNELFCMDGAVTMMMCCEMLMDALLLSLALGSQFTASVRTVPPGVPE